MTTFGLLSIDGTDDNGKHLYVFTEHAKAFANGDVINFWLYQTSVGSKSGAAIPECLWRSNFCEPTDAAKSPWATRTGKPFLDYLQSNPEVFSLFNGLLKLRNENSVPWFTYYPASEMIKGVGGPLLVDIGGGTGQDINCFHTEICQELAPGQLILQDLPRVIEEAGELPPAIHKQAHDFFTGQPVKGAKAYFM